MRSLLLCADAVAAGADLAAGRLACPSCGTGRLARWGYGRARAARLLGGEARWVRPDRTRCRSCGATRILLPAWCAPRRVDAVEVIATGLALALRGAGSSRIGAELGVPAATARVAAAAAVAGAGDALLRQGRSRWRRSLCCWPSWPGSCAAGRWKLRSRALAGITMVCAVAVGLACWLEVIEVRLMPLLFYPYGDPAALLPGATLTVVGLAAGAVALARARRQRAAGTGLEPVPG